MWFELACAGSSVIVKTVSCPARFTKVRPYSEHRFPAPFSNLCHSWLRHWRGALYLRAAVHRRCQRPPKGLGTKKTVEPART